jgi:hypothetical protein
MEVGGDKGEVIGISFSTWSIFVSERFNGMETVMVSSVVTRMLSWRRAQHRHEGAIEEVDEEVLSGLKH